MRRQLVKASTRGELRGAKLGEAHEGEEEDEASEIA